MGIIHPFQPSWFQLLSPLIQIVAVIFQVLSWLPFFLPSDLSLYNRVIFAKCKFCPSKCCPCPSIRCYWKKDKPLSWGVSLSSAQAEAGLFLTHFLFIYTCSLSSCHKSHYCSQGQAIPLMRTSLLGFHTSFPCRP